MNLLKNYLQNKFIKTNEVMTKKDIFYGFLFSPLSGLILTNFVYLMKAIPFYFSNINQLGWQENVIMSVPFVVGLIALLIYARLMYKHKCFYMSVSGSLFARLLTFILFILIGSFIVAKLNASMIFMILFVNFLIIVIYLLYGKSNIVNYSSVNNPISFRLVFVDVKALGKVTTFVKNMNIFYYADYVMLKQYKINYKDVSMLENQYNKKLYDFSPDELAVATMYAFK